MATIVPFRRQKRLKSLDELEGPVFRILPTKPINAAWLIAGGLLAGAGLGVALVTLT